MLYLPTQIRFPIRRTRVTCRGSKLTNSLGRTKLRINYEKDLCRKQELELSTRTWSGRAPWNRSKFEPAGLSKRFLRNFSYFWVGTSMFLSANIEGLRETNALFPAGPVISAYCFIACVAGRRKGVRKVKLSAGSEGEGTTAILTRLFSRFMRSSFPFPSPSDACHAG